MHAQDLQSILEGERESSCIGFLNYDQVLELTDTQPYSAWKGFLGIFRNMNFASQIRHDSLRPAELLESEVSREGPSVSALPMAFVIPVVGRMRLSYDIGRARHAFLINRINREAPQFSFSSLIGDSLQWICSSEGSFRAYAQSIARLLYDAKISCQIITLHRQKNSQYDSAIYYRIFCEGIMKELERYAQVCSKHDQELREVDSRFQGHFNDFVFQKSYNNSMYGNLTADGLPKREWESQ